MAKQTRKRKGAGEWRLMSGIGRAKDGRFVLLAFPDPARKGVYIVQQCYWHIKSKTWFLANTSPGENFDAAADLFGEPELWLPMPTPIPPPEGIENDARETMSTNVVQIAPLKRCANAHRAKPGKKFDHSLSL